MFSEISESSEFSSSYDSDELEDTFKDSQSYISEIDGRDKRLLSQNKNLSYTRFLSKREKDFKRQNLPDDKKGPKLNLKSTSFLKLFMQKDDIHGDREKATSISRNLCT
jgi:hypothetical protein